MLLTVIMQPPGAVACRILVSQLRAVAVNQKMALCCGPAATRNALARFALRPGKGPNVSIVRYTNSEGGGAFKTAARRRTLREIAMSPTTGTPFNIGQGALLGASAFGLGALCYYGLGLAKEPGAIDKAVVWPEYVKQRIRATYMYFGGGIAITAASALAAFRSPVIMNLVMRNSFLAMAGTIAVMIGSGMIVHSMPYKEGFGAKQVAWAVHSGIMGMCLAPICMFGGPILMRAAWYTAGVVGGLSLCAACAPSERFLNMGGPLAIGLGVVFVSSLGSMFLPPTTALGAGLYSMSLYGGLILFSGFLLYDTQRIVKVAETYPPNNVYPYDPINMSLTIYMDTLNIFIRIVQILGGGGQRRK